MDISQIGVVVGLPIVRSTLGWAENAVRDGKITSFEWRELAATVIRMTVLGLATFYGLGEAGIDVSALGAAASAILMDFALVALKKARKK